MHAGRAHVPVMAAEVLAALAPRADGIYLDATYGRGGHTGMLLEQLAVSGRLYAMDKDDAAVAHGRSEFGRDARFAIAKGSFAMLETQAQHWGIAGRVLGLVFDLGVSSPQIDDAERGFSFAHDGPLDMRMDRTTGPSAADWLVTATEADIARVLREYGEERFAGRIAGAIVAQRRTAPLTRTGELAALIARSVPTREPGKHPATRSFQALRIHINGELADLAAVLPQVASVLAPGGRVAFISFHSLEDRLIKRFVRGDDRPRAPDDLPVTAAAAAPPLRALGKAQRPGAAEMAANPRARSAVLRVAERRP